MTTAEFLADLTRVARAKGDAWALDEIAGWRAAERADPHPMTREDWAALAVAEAELRR